MVLILPNATSTLKTVTSVPTTVFPNAWKFSSFSTSLTMLPNQYGRYSHSLRKLLIRLIVLMGRKLSANGQKIKNEPFVQTALPCHHPHHPTTGRTEAMSAETIAPTCARIRFGEMCTSFVLPFLRGLVLSAFFVATFGFTICKPDLSGDTL